MRPANIFVAPVIVLIFRDFSVFKFFGFLKPSTELVIEISRIITHTSSRQSRQRWWIVWISSVWGRMVKRMSEKLFYHINSIACTRDHKLVEKD